MLSDVSCYAFGRMVGLSLLKVWVNKPWADSALELYRRKDMWRKVHRTAVACRHHKQGIHSKASVLRTTEYR